MSDKLPADGTVVHFLCTVPAELVSAQESRVLGLRQTNATVGWGGRTRFGLL
jgi:hypothetical protein